MNLLERTGNFIPQFFKPGIQGMVLAIAILFTLNACSDDFLLESELQAFVLESKHLSKEREYKGFNVKLSYRPNDLLIAQELGGNKVSLPELNSLRGKYEGYYYFVLRLSKEDKEALYQSQSVSGQFSDLVQTLSFRMSNYVNMTTSGKDTIEVADYVFPRTYGMGGATNLMFVFNKADASQDEWVQFNLKEFGLGLGNQNFRFKREDLENAPHIKFQIEK